MGIFPLVGLLCLLLHSGCKLERRERREQELARLEQYLKGKGDTVFNRQDILYAPVRAGEQVQLSEEVAVVLRYSLYALSGPTPQLLSSNIVDDLVKAKMPTDAPTAQDPMLLSMSDERLLEGLRKGIQLFAQEGGAGWLGIPSELGYGERSVGQVKKNSPLVCYIECVEVR